MNLELALLLAMPVAGAATLAALGARRFAPEINVGFSAATFLAACALASRVIGGGSFTAFGEQFFGFKDVELRSGRLIQL